MSLSLSGKITTMLTAGLLACSPAFKTQSQSELPSKFEASPSDPDSGRSEPAPNPAPAPTPVPSLPAPISGPESGFSLKSEVEKWKQVFPSEDPSFRYIDNKGNGDPSLYGVRNFRVVLHGVYYRGGANNRYLEEDPRDNMNPLPDEGLENLCRKGFAESIYYYSTRFETASPVTRCRTLNGDDNSLRYLQKTALNPANHTMILGEIFRRIRGQVKGPIYGHCWNGWHASGAMAAIALQQFCHWTPEEATTYWVQNTDGNSSGYDKVKELVRTFQRIPSLEISAVERQLICPQQKTRPGS